jgi:hypothetical protein
MGHGALGIGYSILAPPAPPAPLPPIPHSLLPIPQLKNIEHLPTADSNFLTNNFHSFAW